MPYFAYIAKDQASRTVRGKEFSASEQDLVSKLMKAQLAVISVKKADAARRRAIKTFDLIIFCRQLAAMVKGGVPFIRALDVITTETHDETFRAALTEIGDFIRDGDPFSTALKKMPHLVSPLFVAIVEAGEKVGAVPAMLERLSSYLEARDRINKKIIAAITYPSIVLIVFVGVMTIMTLFLIPKFKGIYEGFGAKLPPLTLAVFRVSDFMIKNILLIMIIAAAAVFFLRRWITTTKVGRYFFSNLILKIPIFGDVIRKAAMSKFARTISTLIGQGIPVPQSFDLVSKTSANTVIEDAGLEAARLILNGDKIPEALKKVKIFPTLMVQMAAIGVESGNLPELLDKTADFYESQVDVFVNIMSSLIEPILIVALGASLAVIIVALYLPIFKLGQAVTGSM